MVRKNQKCDSGCVKYTALRRCQRDVRKGSTGYQRRDPSNILLLEDKSDEHYTAKCWKD